MKNLPTSTQVSSMARETHMALSEALDWTMQSKDTTIHSNAKLAKDLRVSIYQAKKIEESALRKMCVGVYGASQAGKSYLVSVLARKGTNRLMAVMGSQEIDFIAKINPEGGKESTGLVTRFTTDVLKTPAGYPIKAGLLTETDIIKLLANSYVNDVDTKDDEQQDIHEEQINLVLKELEDYPRVKNHLQVEDVYELEDYCNSRFKNSIRFQALKKIDFWSRAADLMPNLGDPGRQKLVELLWEGLISYSSMYSSLVEQLNQLGHAKTIYCAAEALFDVSGSDWHRSNESIINVSTLEKFSIDEMPPVAVVTEGEHGKPVLQATIFRSHLTALIAEMVVQMKEEPHAFFAHTDLLDFPGARSRKVQPKEDKILNSQEVKVENFLRGKVAYLFDRYSIEFELSSMLLCVGPSNLEVVGLDKLVEDWVINTHGVTPEKRSEVMTALFLVLTKFDMEFSQGAGRSADGNRWSTRLEASLLKPFGAHSHRSNWVGKWHSDSAFNNSFWLRNPNADQAGLIDYQGEPGSSPETGISPAKKDFVNTLRAAFLSNPAVNKHFADPALAWDAGMALNDGGISRLIGALALICKPEVKLSQVLQRLQAIIDDRRTDLAKYYISNDVETLRLEKFALAKDFVLKGASLLKRQRLGDFIPMLLIDNADAYDVFDRAEKALEREKHAYASNSNEGQQATEVLDDDLAALLGGMDDQQQATPKNALQAPEDGSVEDLPKRFVRELINHWNATVLERTNSGHFSEYLNMNRETLIKLINEIEISARRSKLIDDMIHRVERSYQFKTNHRRKWVLKLTEPVTAMFNEFIVSGATYESGKTSFEIYNLDDKPVKIFAPLPEIEETLVLPDIAADFSRQYFADWLLGLQHSIRKNADFLSGVSGDIEGNRALGVILKKLSHINQPSAS
jgi:hypothetical protein